MEKSGGQNETELVVSERPVSLPLAQPGFKKTYKIERESLTTTERRTARKMSFKRQPDLRGRQPSPITQRARISRISTTVTFETLNTSVVTGPLCFFVVLP